MFIVVDVAATAAVVIGTFAIHSNAVHFHLIRLMVGISHCLAPPLPPTPHSHPILLSYIIMVWRTKWRQKRMPARMKMRMWEERKCIPQKSAQMKCSMPFMYDLYICVRSISNFAKIKRHITSGTKAVVRVDLSLNAVVGFIMWRWRRRRRQRRRPIQMKNQSHHNDYFTFLMNGCAWTLLSIHSGFLCVSHFCDVLIRLNIERQLCSINACVCQDPTKECATSDISFTNTSSRGL